MYFVTLDINNKEIEGGSFNSKKDAIRWFNMQTRIGWLHLKKCGGYIEIDTNPDWINDLS